MFMLEVEGTLYSIFLVSLNHKGRERECVRVCVCVTEREREK